ncbi:MAG: anti-sigma factor, partial [Planctomycetota bacterium]
MKRHFTEEELIKFHFKLLTDEQSCEIEEHLQDCDICRQTSERLNRKFASLEMLREEVNVSEELISNVLTEATETVKAKGKSFKIPAWLGAAAAIIIVAAFLIIHTQTDKRAASEVAKDADTKGIQKKLEGVEEVSEPDASFGGLREPAKPFGAKSDEFMAGLAGDRVLAEAEDIEEQAPFAPASAIELVVLPRRENVQLTIYNSADLTLVRERRNLTLKRGWNWLQFMWANTLIDPTSLELEPLEQRDKIDVQQLVYPARLREIGRWLIRSETEGQVPFEITYFTSGLNWRAFYMGTLSEDENAMQLQGYVRVDNGSGEDYEKAQTRLIVGQVHLLDAIAELAQREHAHGRPEI